MAFRASLADDRGHVLRPDNLLHPDVPRVEHRLLSPSLHRWLHQHLVCLLGVVAFRRADGIRVDYLRLAAHAHRVLVSVKSLVALLCPAGVNVFVAFLVRLVVASSSSAASAPQLVAFALLYLLVLLMGVALSGRDDEADIDYLPLVEYQPQRGQILVEPFE